MKHARNKVPALLARTRFAAARAMVTCALALAVVACSGPPAREAQSPREVVNELRASLVTMTNDEAGREVALELDRARTLLQQADSAVEKGEDAQRTSLLIELSRGQLILAKSVLERRKAEVALAAKSEEYRKARGAEQTIVNDTRAFDPPSGEEPQGDAP